MDTFKIVAPGLKDSNNPGVVRVAPSTYARLAALSLEHNISICRIVDQCVLFALERMEGGGDAK
jgi:hypothetical protein